MTSLVCEISDILNGLKAKVYKVGQDETVRYHVALEDSDAGETVQIFRIYENLADAKAYASSLVKNDN